MTHHSPISRRDLLKLSATGVIGASMSNWLPALASETPLAPQQNRSVIVLWMTGGASQIDTFDLKPHHENGGPFRPIATSAPGIEICEHLPEMSKWMDHCIPIRSMCTPENDHVNATRHLRTANKSESHFPTNSLQNTQGSLPSYVALSPYTRWNPVTNGAAFFAPQVTPVIVGEANRPGLNPHAAALHEVTSNASILSQALRLDDERTELRDAYGRNHFGQGCLAARRLVERGATFVEVSLNDAGNRHSFAWDTHANNFESTKNLMHVLDPAWATLVADLKDRGLLESTLIVWMGEFGRTPTINAQLGRDHYSAAWTTVLCGGGIDGGRAIGMTSADGQSIVDQPFTAQDLLATIGSWTQAGSRSLLG